MSMPYHYSLDTNFESKEVKGVLSFLDDELLFEFKVYDMYGNATSSLNKFAINVEQLKRLHFKKGFFSGKLILEARQMAFFEPIPGSEQGVIKLNIKRADRDEAVRFSTRLNLYLSQKRLDELRN